MALLASAVLSTGCTKPRCRGEPDKDEMRRMQELVAANREPCPEHVKPVIELDASGIVVNGHRVARAEDLPSDRPRKIQGLFDELKHNREIWKQLHPGSMFEASPKLRIAPGIDPVVCTSTVLSTAFAGYPDLDVVSGSTELRMRYDVPGPPNPDAEPRLELHLERVPDGRQLVRFQRDNAVVVASPELGFETVPGWVSQYALLGCPDVVVARPSGDFVVTLTLLRNVLDAPAMGRCRPLIRLAQLAPFSQQPALQ